MDLHKCGDCQEEFRSFEDFLIHKLVFERYTLKIEPCKRIPNLRIPQFVKPIDEPSDELNASPALAESSPPLSISPSSRNEPIVDVTCEEVSDKSDDSEHHNMPTREECNSVNVQNKESESDDNISVWSQAESLRIDESALTKDPGSSPMTNSNPEEVNENSKFYCNLCDRSYKNKIVFRVHKDTVHSTKRPFSCKYCDQTFKTKGCLVRHVRIHTGVKPFRCSKCSRAFTDSGTLCRHISRVHCSNFKQESTHVLYVTSLDSSLKKTLPNHDSAG